MQADALTAPRWERLSELIAARTGLHFPPERRADLRRALDQAAPDFGLAGSDSCADWLLSSTLSPKELATLSRHLTIGETYFFRERSSFNALASHVLPLLIHQKRCGDRRLRLWSAACSSGEDAYSLAMLIQQVLPDWRDWKISILATDINPQVLRKAEAAVYGEWSFRECAPEMRERFFSPVGDRRYRVHADVRAMVSFAELNLSQDAFPSPVNDTQSMDLILCRNLLIYFTPQHTRQLIANLRRSLVDDGWLIVSPSECSQALFSGFVPVNLPGSILYRKRDRADVEPERMPEAAAAFAGESPAPMSETEVARMLAAPTPPAAPVPVANPTLATLADAEAMYASGRYADTASVLRRSLTRLHDAERLRALALLARSLANQGEIQDALTASEQWLAADKLDPAAHYLNAMVLQELGDRERARTSLQRAVYLQPDFTLAHFALGNHARAGARHAEARKHFENAAHLLRGHAEDEAVAESEGLTAGRLREIITALTSGLDA
jgi:chemotaxis protein methyltransferase CheR